MNRIIMLFLGFVITGCVDMHAFGQGRFDSIPANNIQASDAEAAVLKLAGVIKSKDIYGALDKVCEEVERTNAFKEALPVLKQALRDADPDIRFTGLVAIGVLSERLPTIKSLLPEIIALIKDEDAVVRYVAVEALTSIDNIDDALAKRAIPLLIDYLQYEVTEEDVPHTEPRGVIRLAGYWDDFRQEAAKALGKIGPQAVPALMRALNDNNVLVREGAARALAEIGPQARQAAPLLLAAIRDRDSRLRFRAAVALWKVDHQAKPVIPILIEAVQRSNVPVSGLAVDTLGEIGPEAKEAVPALIEVVRKEWDLVRPQAAKALGRIGPEAKAAVPVLIEVLRVEDEPPKLPAYVNDPLPVPDVIKEKNSWLRLEAARAIWLIDGQSKVAVPVLIELLKGKDYLYRSRAAEVLGEIGPAAIDAAPELLKATKDEKPSIRDAAIKALKKIDPKAK